MAPPDVPEIVIPAVRHNLVKTIKLHNLKMLTEKHNDKKLAITLLIIWGGGRGRGQEGAAAGEGGGGIYLLTIFGRK